MTAALNRPFPLPGVEVTITASIGIAYADEGDARTPEQLLHDADMAMYQAKHRGGARQQLFDPREQRLADRQAGLERDLHHAVQRGSCTWSTSPSWPPRTGGSPDSRRCCGGITPPAAWFRRPR